MKQQKRPVLRWATHQQRWFAKWHVYLGIIAGFIVAIVGITGSILVFEDEIDTALNRPLFETTAGKTKMDFAQVVPLVKEQYPQIRIDYIYSPDDKPNSTYIIYDYKTEQQYFIDPYTGRLSGKRLYESGFIHVVTEIHRTLLVPVIGRYIVGLSSLILLILTISGLRLWIPAKWKQLKQVLTVNFKAGFKRQNYDWHNVTGFYSAPVVSLLSLTGFCITFSIIVIPLLFVLSGKSPQGAAQLLGAKSIYSKEAKMLPLTTVIDIANKTMPGSKIAGMAMPADSTGNIRLDISTGQLPKSGKREMLILDQYSGRILLNSRRDFPEVADAYLSWLTPIHFGSFGGLPTRILALIGGLMPAVLFVTGFIIWYPRWKRQASKDIALPRRKINISEEQVVQRPFSYFSAQLKKGFVYALWLALIAAVMGILYGLISGIVLQPAVFTIAFCCTLVVINFVVALLCFLFNLLFLAPFKKGSRRLVRYFALSFSFFAVFVLMYVLLLNTGIDIF